MLSIALFSFILLLLLLPDIFPTCNVCKKRKMRFMFKMIKDMKTAVCGKCSEHFGIDTAADLLLYKTARMKALNKSKE